MSATQTCPKCGAALTGDAFEGLCPTCMVQVMRDVPTIVSVTEKPGDKIGRYKLLQKIGEGGCGIVYLAEQEEPVRRHVALKVIKLGMDTQQVVARFEAERQVLALMDHPNIAKVFDAGATDTGRPYFVMELVRGVRITDYCDQNQLSARERLDLFIQVCQAIQHAHQKGIIHRDIKPSNVLVTQHDGVPVPKVIDFGIAKATTDQRLTDKTLFTAFEQFIGTPAYMSPEQAGMSALDIDTRSDIYSLGVLLYELLTGKTPFDAKELWASGLDAMRKTIREKEPLRPSQVIKSLSERRVGRAGIRASHDRAALNRQFKSLSTDLDWIVMKCLEKDRTRRYDTANGLAMDLIRHLNNEPVVARPPSAAYRFRKAFRRNKLAFVAGGAVALALLAGLATSLWQASVATSARRTTEHHLYLANMNLAQSAWEQNNVSRVRQLLKETATAPNRGFEWYYWQRQLHLELKTLRGHVQPVLAVAYSPDGRRIITGGADNTARVWDAATGAELFSLKGHTREIQSVAFSSDGQRILTASWDRTATVWAATNGQPIVTLRGHVDRVFAAAFSADGQRIVTGSRDRTAKVWDTATGTIIRTLTGHSGVVWAVAFSADGQRIVTGSWDQTARIWNATTGTNLVTFKAHRGPVFSVAFSPDGEEIVSGGLDQTARVWKAGDGRELFQLQGHSAPVVSVCFSSDGQRIATAGDDQTARVWDAGGDYGLLAVKRHGSPISSVTFSPDGRRIATAGGSVAYQPDGQVIGTGRGDKTVKIWEASADTELLTLKGHQGGVPSVAFSSDGQRIVTASLDHTAKVWDAATGKELRTLKGHGGPIRSVAYSPDGHRVVTGSWDKTAKVWETTDDPPRLTLDQHRIELLSVAFSPDGGRIITAGKDGAAKVWNAKSGAHLLTLTNQGLWVWSATFSPDGQRIVTGNENEDVAKVWDANSGKQLLILKGHKGWVFSASFSPDGQRIVTGSHDGEARVWDATSGELQLSLIGHSSWVMSASFSPDGRRLLTSSHDGTAKVWDAATGKELLTFKGHSGWVFSAVFSPDGHRIVTGSGDGTAKVWEAASAEQVARWQRQERSSGL